MRRDAGLTLLELLLVVFILSVLSLGAVSLIDTSDNQWRFDETKSRLARIRAAIVGESGPVHGGAWRLSGFVADAGVPPSDLADLIGPLDEGDEIYGARVPTVGTVELTDHKLFKGRRPPYVVLDASSDPGDPLFQDGWGNGWDFQLDLDASDPPAPLELSVQSYGADGQVGEQWGGDYDADLTPLVLKKGAWSFEGNLVVEVHNRTASDITNLRVDLLVYEDGAWKQVASKSGETIDAKAIAAGSSAQFTIAETIPIGAHLLVLVEDSDQVVDDDDTPYGDSPYVTRIIELYPGLSSVQTDLVVTP